jgi:hypothetical protein
MCKVYDHVSFPSPAGMGIAARASELRVERIWTTALPFEFPVSVLAAARDRLTAGRGAASRAGQPGEPDAPVCTSGNEQSSAGVKSALARFYAAAGPFDPVSRVLGSLGLAGSVKARLIR